jgi:hypothetical protein
VVLAAVLRFAMLDARSYWVDEAVIVNLVELGLFDMLDRLLSGVEGTPPLYYSLAWAWTEAFGTGEVGLRSLSALLGTATVPVAYLAGRELVSSRVGLLAALMLAVSPILVWHSQDARAHSLAVMLSALSFLFFLRALRQPRARTLGWWAATSALGLLAHYFVVFLVAVEAGWLLLAHRSRRALWAALGAVGVAGVTALLIGLEQRGNVDLTYQQYGGLPSRLVQSPAQLLVGEQPFLQRATAVLAAALVLPALIVLVRRASGAERRGALVAAAVAGLALAAMVAAALVGVDYVSARNALPVLLPVLLVVASGFAAALTAWRPALVALAALCALWLAIDVVTADVPKFEREDWRGAAQALGAPTDDRAIVVTPYAGRGPLRVYLDGSRRLESSARISEIDLVGLPRLFRRVGETPRPPRPVSPPPVPGGFRQVERRDGRYYTVIRFRSPGPVELDRATLANGHLGSPPPEILLQPGE